MHVEVEIMALTSVVGIRPQMVPLVLAKLAAQ